MLRAVRGISVFLSDCVNFSQYSYEAFSVYQVGYYSRDERKGKQEGGRGGKVREGGEWRR